MRLFTETTRTDRSPKRWSEPAFRFLDRSARPEAGRIREAWEQWASHYPAEHFAEFRGNFRSADDPQHEGAAFELLLHELLRRLGCRVEVHPLLEYADKRPDFRVSSPSCGDYLVEATICVDHPDRPAGNRLADLRDSLDRIAIQEYFFDLRYDGLPEVPVPGRQIRSRIEASLRDLDIEAMRQAAENGDWDALPSWTFAFPGIDLRITAYPVRAEHRAASSRAIGVSMGGLQVLQTDRNIRDALLAKASRYGAPDVPYVIAVNAIGEFPADSIDVFNALMGREAIEAGLTAEGERVEREIRLPDGLWHGPNGLQNRRVSAVLVGTSVGPWNLDRGVLQLVTNPHAYHPYDCELTQLDSWVPVDAGTVYHKRPGLTVRGLLSLPAGWPSALPSSQGAEPDTDGSGR